MVLREEPMNFNQPSGNLATQNFTLQLSAMGVQPASTRSEKSRIVSRISELDSFLEGGLPVGTVCEWGVPLGRGGRELLLAWLTAKSQEYSHYHTGDDEKKPHWSLWIHSFSDLDVYPPAWGAKGVSLKYLRFACSTRPLADLKPVFMDSLFKVIVIDSPQSFSDEDCSFLARQARLNGFVILLLRNFFLSPKRGNVWAKLRLNSYYSNDKQSYQVEMVRGLSPRKLSLDAKIVRRRLSLQAA
jgi:hypothetical protein